MRWLAFKLVRFLSNDDLRHELMHRGFTEMDITTLQGNDTFVFKAIGIKEKK